MLKDIYITFHDPIWTVALFVALYFPLKKILLNLYLRKHFKEKGEPDEEVKKKLNNRARLTSVLLSFVFSYLYVQNVF